MTPEEWIRLEGRVRSMETAYVAISEKQDAMDEKVDRILNLLEVGRLGAAFIKACVAFGVAVVTLWIGYKSLK